MAYQAEANSLGPSSQAEVNNLCEIISTSLDLKIPPRKHDDEIVLARMVLDEPERERSPDTPRALRYGATGEGDISSVPELDYSHLREASRGRQRTDSWLSTATDFDDLTSPGAQAERSEAYRQAVYGSMQHAQPFAFWNGPFIGSLANNQNERLINSFVTYAGTAEQLYSQAEELNLAADQLMSAAKQAQDHVTAVHIEKQRRDSATPSVRSVSTVDAQKPRWSDFEPECEIDCMSSPSESGRTTVMLRNLPNDYTREMLLELLDSHGFRGHYNFFYLPVDFKRRASLGYAFLNMATPAAAERLFAVLQGFTRWQYCSSKVLELAWGEPLQGLDAHIDRYRNSPVMHREVPDKFKPLLFEGGVRVPFPLPTKRLEKPRSKARQPSA